MLQIIATEIIHLCTPIGRFSYTFVHLLWFHKRDKGETHFFFVFLHGSSKVGKSG